MVFRFVRNAYGTEPAEIRRVETRNDGLSNECSPVSLRFFVRAQERSKCRRFDPEFWICGPRFRKVDDFRPSSDGDDGAIIGQNLCQVWARHIEAPAIQRGPIDPDMWRF